MKILSGRAAGMIGHQPSCSIARKPRSPVTFKRRGEPEIERLVCPARREPTRAAWQASHPRL